jgi:hypothetical protein
MKRIATVELTGLNASVTDQLVAQGLDPVPASVAATSISTARCMGSRQCQSDWNGVTYKTVRREFEPNLVDVFELEPLTEEQRRIQEAAENLLVRLNTMVPESTAHFAVEDARKALRVLAFQAATIVTNDVKAARENAAQPVIPGTRTACPECRESITRAHPGRGRWFCMNCDWTSPVAPANTIVKEVF